MPLTMDDLAEEIGSDPAGLGYAPLSAAGADGAIAELLNATTGPGAGTVALDVASRGDFLAAIRPAYLTLPSLSPEMQAKWDRILEALNTSSSITVDATTLGLLSVAVAEGVLTQAQADSAWHRAGSRAEVLFGPGVAVDASDVSHALGRS